MFQRLSNLLFGEVEEVAAEINGPNPCVTEADEEGWMIVNVPVDTECMIQVESENPPLSQSFPNSQLNNTASSARTDCSGTIPNPLCRRRRTHKDRSSYCCTSVSDLSVTTPGTLCRGTSRSLPSSTPSVSPGSRGEWGGSGGSSRTGSERGCMDESWFVTPPPCFTAEGATAEASPMEDLLIEHPSMSVYVSQNSTGVVSGNNLPVVREESLMGSMSRMTETSALPTTCATLPTRVNRGAATQAGALAKVTQMARVQRSKARIERRRLGRNHIQRQNRSREQVPHHAAHVRNGFLHQPCKRNLCH